MEITAHRGRDVSFFQDDGDVFFKIKGRSRGKFFFTNKQMII